MTLAARSNAEAHLYMELNPCQRCGEIEFAPGCSVRDADGTLVARYAGPCPGCGTAREFTFRLPAGGYPGAAVDDRSSGDPSFGGTEPSQLIDAGEWIWVAETIARSIPGHAGLPDTQRARAGFDLRTAAAAIDEAIKFVPPGADAVPAEALCSERGRDLYRADPRRFRRRRLEAVRQAYRNLAASVLS
jgi:hypothetical protein